MAHKSVNKLILGTIVLNGAINNSQTSFSVTGNLTSVPTDTNTLIRIENEIMEITNIAGQVLTVVRGFGGSVSAAHSDGVTVRWAVLAEHINELIDEKVDKVVGKNLSTEDYTTAEKSKLLGIANNANNYIHPPSHSISFITNLSDSLDSKENSVVGKGLSTEDYTTTEKSKLLGIANNAQVNAPIATNAEALDGTNNTKTMTPLRVKEVVDSIDVPVPVFGDDYEFLENTTASSTSGLLEVTQATYSFTGLVTSGFYKVSIDAYWNYNNSSNRFILSFKSNGTEIHYVEQEPKDILNTYWDGSFFKLAPNASGEITITVDFTKTSSNGTATVYRSKVELFRVL